MAHGARLFSLVRLGCVLGGSWLAVFGSFYLLESSAQTEDVEKPVEQNLVNGRLAFTRQVTTQMSQERWIETSNPDGSAQAALPVSGMLKPTEPSWSPDGTKIVYAITQAPNEIYLINANGTGDTNLTNTASSNESNPTWSVAGKIAYKRDGQIWTMNADGSGQAHFSAITQPSPTDPSWSPNGAKLAFVSGGEIWVINSDGTNQQRLTMDATTDTGPTWSPDGSKILFTPRGSPSPSRLVLSISPVA